MIASKDCCRWRAQHKKSSGLWESNRKSYQERGRVCTLEGHTDWPERNTKEINLRPFGSLHGLLWLTQDPPPVNGTEQSRIHEQLNHPHIERMPCWPNWTHEESILCDPEHIYGSKPALMKASRSKIFFRLIAIYIPASHMGSKWH